MTDTIVRTQARRLRERLTQVDYNSVSLKSRGVVDSSGVPFDLRDVRRQNVRLSFGLVSR